MKETITRFRVHHTRDTFVRQHHVRGPRAAPPHQGLQGQQRRRMCPHLPDRLRQHRKQESEASVGEVASICTRSRTAEPA